MIWDSCLRQLHRMVESSLQYGYEYFGSYERLVMTPLTEKCFLVLTIALHHIKGGSVEGPTGTGKTETVEDIICDSPPFASGEGPVEGVREAVHSVQLLGRLGISTSWQVHQRTCL